jgi:hypothetical protein
VNYNPKPIDTSKIALPEGLRPLVEHLAENTHDIWAVKRMSEGWSYGPRRDDELRTHPCLIPYADLPSSEKDYDRVVVTEVVKAIIALGYQIVPNLDSANI